MKTLDRSDRLIAIGLAAMAGMVDAIGFLASGGFFVSFMSGNSTRLSVGMAEGAAYVGIAAALILAFLAGVVFGSMIGRQRPMAASHRQAGILAAIAILLILAPVVATNGMLLPAICMTAFAMGAENTLFERGGTVSFGLTYMTGALVKIGQGLATLFSGGARFDWLPYLQLWLGLVGGAVLGALLYAKGGIFSLWLPAVLAARYSLLIYRRRQA